MAEPKSRREAIKSRPRECRKLDKTPVEIPVGRKTIPDTRDMVRQYVQQALVQSGAKEGYASVDEMVKEELDLDPEDPEPPWTSQYEVQEMGDEEPHEVAPPGEGVPAPPQNEVEEENPE